MADSNSKDKKKSKKQGSWPLRVFLLAVALSAVMSFFSSTALEGAGYMVTLLVLAMFIALGIIFDRLLFLIIARLTRLSSLEYSLNLRPALATFLLFGAIFLLLLMVFSYMQSMPGLQV